MISKLTKTALAQELGVSLASLYYKPKQFNKDWHLKILLEQSLNQHPSYGHKRLAILLKINKKRILRVMKLFGIKPYRRRGRKYKKTKEKRDIYHNLLLANIPSYPNHIWASDFTHFSFHGNSFYLATIIDILTREVVGFSIMTSHGVQLVISALLMAITNHQRPEIIHSDQGSEYRSETYTSLIQSLGIKISMSHVASPWENGYQESFYNQFKIDLGDPNRFDSLGELIAEIYQMIHIYNTIRIHSKLKMAPKQYLN